MKTMCWRIRIQSAVLGLLLGSGVMLPFHSGMAQTMVSARSVPTWLREGVVYELFPRQFSATGDFKGITSRLDELNNLGVTIIWLMPIHPIGEELRKGSCGSPYAVRDYYAVNPDYGTQDDLKRLVAEAHRRGIRVILDVVLLHTAWDNVLMSHPEYYKHDADGKIVPPVAAWTDVAGLNYENAELREYMITMLNHWVAECDVDGFRCDTASMVPTSFWEEARTALMNTKPDIMLLAEADKPELLTQAFDIDYAWPLLNTLRSVLGKSAPASEIQQTWERDLKRYPSGALRLTMSDNHDQARAVACFGVRGALAASALMLTLDGVPLLYNGMEVGDATESGDPALFEKVPILWHPKDRPPLREIYRDLIKLRKANAALQGGRVEWISNTAPESLVTFMRSDDKNEFLIAINFSNRSLSAKMNCEGTARFSPVSIKGINPSGNSPLPYLQLEGFEWRIYRSEAAMAAK